MVIVLSIFEWPFYISFTIISIIVENTVNPDRLASLEASQSGSTVFSKKYKSGLSMTRVIIAMP